MKTTAIVLAAGQGTRMKSDLPKVLHPVCGKPMIEWVRESLITAQADRILFVLGHKGEQVAAYLGQNEHQEIVYQTQQLGTGHAVMQAAEKVADEDGVVMVVCGDTPLLRGETLQDMLAKHKESQAAVTVMTAYADNPFGYGRILRNDQGRVTAIVEQKDATEAQKTIREINAGTYCFDQRFLLEALKKITPNNAQGEYYLTDVIALAVAEGKSVVGYMLEDFSESLGVNNRVQQAQAEKMMNKRKAEALMLAGVTIIDPDHCYIQGEVSIGRDSVLWPGCILQGRVVIGERCEIGPNCRIQDSTIGDGCQIQQATVLESTIGNECKIGPFAYLRPQSVLADRVKIGDFVEIKKSTIGLGSKVPHHSYIGDTQMGGGVNIGCGTITCNYDGVNKYPTIIGEGAFIGSNTNLVAPVTVEDHAFVAAGTTLTKDAPAYSLSLTRAPLTIKEDWVRKKAQKQEK